MTETEHLRHWGCPGPRANHRPLTPLDFLAWSASVFPDRTGVVYGEQRFSWGEVDRRCRRLASALRGLGVGRGDTRGGAVPQHPADARGALRHSDGGRGAQRAEHPPRSRLDRLHPRAWRGQGAARRHRVGAGGQGGAGADGAHHQPSSTSSIRRQRASGWASSTTRRCWRRAIPPSPGSHPADEWDAISLCYTSGTTGNPKGVVYHHRGAFLNAMGNALVFGLNSRSSYLWTLPMFHCNGWTYTWAVTAVGGTHVCLRKVDPAVIFPLIEEAGVTHLCGAPIVLNMLVHAPDRGEAQLRPDDRGRDRRRGTAQRGDRGHGADGLSCHSPLRPDRELRTRHRVRRAAGLARPAAHRARRAHGAPGRALPDACRDHGRRPGTHAEVPSDGTTLGEIMLRGNTLMKGYLKNPSGDGRGVQGRLVPHRRPRRPAPRRLRRGQGPLQGHHHLGRREHLVARGRGGALPASGGDGGGGGRDAGRRAMASGPAPSSR